MSGDKKLSRRKFLKIAGGTVGVGIAACGGAALIGTRTPSSVKFFQGSCSGGSGKKVLIAYYSRSGATGEIAAEISQSLCAAGWSSDVRLMRDIASIAGYDAVVIGGPVYMVKIMGDCVSFIKNNLEIIQRLPSAYFSVGLTMKRDTAENRELMREYNVSALDLFQPTAVEFFAGRIDWDTLPPLYRAFAKADAEGILAEGDYRDWSMVKAWGAVLPAQLNL